MAKKKPGAQQAQSDPPPSSSSLIICRNKHWRYISSFHGPWLQLPPEILESLAHQNFSMPAPRLIDPAVFYDVVKIRRAIDEAAEDAVRASTGVSNTAMHGRMDYFGGTNGPGSQLSKERIFKIRQKAVKSLSKAFALDEVAASVASMQGTSTVHDVGQHVLKREPNNIDAKYVHYFHEKIPSRCMEDNTPLEPLNEIISSLPMELQGPPLRTRGLVQIFKKQWEGAAADFTAALRITEELKRMHKPDQQQLELASKMREEHEAWNRSHRDWRSVPHLKEEDQPSSLEQQLLFNRAGVYLTIACQSVHAALDGLKEYQGKQEKGELTAQDAKGHEFRLEARKKVKMNAKRALKDYTAFLSHFDYTPGLSHEFTDEIMRRMNDLSNGTKSSQTQQIQDTRVTEIDDSDDTGSEHPGQETQDTALIKHSQAKRNSKPMADRDDDGWSRIQPPKIHSASALFAEKPPSDLPPFPALDTAHNHQHEAAYEAMGSREAVTYHPLLTDALHSLLLAHALLQTSPTELLRHANNAARLARIADGYPLFQAARSPARADWIEVLRRANNWLGLSMSWQKLCAPTPLSENTGTGNSVAKKGSSTHREHNPSTTSERQLAQRELKRETADQKRERIKQESIIDALSDDRVVDEVSFQRAVRAREQRAMEDEEGISGPLKDKDASSSASSTTPSTPAEKANGGPPAAKRWAQADRSKEYPISTVRAEAIARWIKEAPFSMGGKKKRAPRKRPAGNSATNGVHSAANGVGGLHLGNCKDNDDDGPD